MHRAGHQSARFAQQAALVFVLLAPLAGYAQATATGSAAP